MTVNHIVLFEPQIPANTGISQEPVRRQIRHCTWIEPLGFSTDDKHLKRAGLDYWHDVDITYHKSLEAFLEYLGERPLYLITKFANHTYDEGGFSPRWGAILHVRKETTGLPEEFMRENEEKCLRLPMNDTHVRSLNLSNTAAIVVYEALRQQRFAGLELVHTYDHDKLK